MHKALYSYNYAKKNSMLIGCNSVSTVTAKAMAVLFHPQAKKNVMSQSWSGPDSTLCSAGCG